LSVTLLFESQYDMMPYAWDENWLNWDYGHISYHKLFTVVSEAVAGIAHIYWNGVSKYKFLSELLGRPIVNVQAINCRSAKSFKHKYSCNLPCYRFADVSGATKTAYSLYDCLVFHLQTKSYAKRLKDMRRYTAKFVSGT
jgi:hypothetical protein